MIRYGTLVSGVETITGLERTSDLYVGQYVYGQGIPPDTSIITVGSGQVTLNRQAVQTGTFSLEFTSCSEGVYMDRLGALSDVQMIVNERGGIVQFVLRKETDVTRDAYGSIASKSQNQIITLRSFPIEMQPSNKQLEKAGIREQQDAVIYTSMKEWTDAGIDPKSKEMIRSTVKMYGETYQIKEIGMVSQYNDTFLYITFGISKQ